MGARVWGLSVRVYGKVAIAVAATVLISGPALAGKGGGGNPPPPPPPTLATCGANDITAPTVTILACQGFKSGNLLNQANASTDQQILQSLGYDHWDGKFTDVAGSVSNLKGSQTVNFGVKLTGISIIAVHYGGGTGSPGAQSTAFYVLDAAQGINQIHLSYKASSNAVLFVTGLPRMIESVPEPSSWATMVCGFGLLGGQMRRRRKVGAQA